MYKHGTSPQQMKLPLRKILGYGVGDFAFNLVFTFCSLFLLYFYTDVLGMPGTTAGLIIMAALVWEGITDPLVGVLANRTRSRWGRYRPYLLLGAIPLALSFVAMMVPLGLSGSALTAYCFATHLVFRTVFTFVNVPYIALSARITNDSNERGKLAAARMLFAMTCGILLSALTLPLVKSFGGGNQGYFTVAALYGGALIIILGLCFASTSEAVDELEPAHPSLREMLGSLRSNQPFLLLLVATVLGSIAFTMSGKALVYYMKYWVGSEKAVTAGLLTMLLSAAVATLIWLIVTQRTSKRTVWIAGACFSVTAFLLIFTLRPASGWTLWLLLSMTGIGNGAFALTFWSMLPDTVEYGEWQTGSRTEGAIFGFIALSQKVALGLGTGLIGVLLDVIGYHANVAQTPETLDGLVRLYTLAPAALFAAAAAIIFFYPIDRATHERLVREISARR